MKFRKKRNKFIFKVVHKCDTCGLRYYCLFNNITDCSSHWNAVIGDIIFRQIIKHTHTEIIKHTRTELYPTKQDGWIITLIPIWIDYLIRKKLIKKKTIDIIRNNGWL